MTEDLDQGTSADAAASSGHPGTEAPKPAMVERVARAICEAERMNPDDPLGGWRHWTDAARAAITAMREPTAAMIDASCTALVRFQDQGGKCDGLRMKHRLRWRAAIDTALSPPLPKAPGTPPAHG